MAAFLDADGLNIFYGLIAAKFGNDSVNGSMDYSRAQYSGDGKTTTDDLYIRGLKRSTDLNAGPCDLLIISGTPKNENGCNSIGVIWGGTGYTGCGLVAYKDYSADILTISMLVNVQVYVTMVDGASVGRIHYEHLPAGFTPYDPAFTALQPDYAKAMLRDADTFYTAGFFRFSNTIIDGTAT